jgi:hypothetical protein
MNSVADGIVMQALGGTAFLDAIGASNPTIFPGGRSIKFEIECLPGSGINRIEVTQISNEFCNVEFWSIGKRRAELVETGYRLAWFEARNRIAKIVGIGPSELARLPGWSGQW